MSEWALADMIFMVHVFFIAFVVFGFVLIVVGVYRRWQWIRNYPFRLAHLLSIGFVVAETWLGYLCPLTEWESRLRMAAGGVEYPEPFIQFWLHKLIFLDFPLWVFTLVYTVFAVLVLLLWLRAPPVRIKK